MQKQIYHSAQGVFSFLERNIDKDFFWQISLNTMWYGQKVAKGKFFRFHTSDKNAKYHVMIFCHWESAVLQNQMWEKKFRENSLRIKK